MLNLCIVGTGGIATEHMKAFNEIKGVRPLWVISRTLRGAKEFAHLWGFEHASVDLNEALSDPRVHLVIIASPSDQHTPQTLMSIQARKNVIVEIPVGLSFADAERVATVASRSQGRVLVCHTMRSFPAIREVRRRVQDGELKLSQIVGHFAIPRRRNQSRVGQRNWIDDLLWHHGCHMVDAALWVLSAERVEQVDAVIGRPHKTFGMIMDTSIHFRTSTQEVVTESLTYNAEQLCWEIRFIGDEETLIFKNGALLNEKGEEVIARASYLDLAPQDTQMLATLVDGAPSDYDISSVIGAMKILDQAAASAEYSSTGTHHRADA